MDVAITKRTVSDYIQSADIDDRIKTAIVADEKLTKRIEKWIGKQVRGSQYFAVKVCNVHHIDYENIELEEIEDEFERAQLKKKIENNKFNCPHHMLCPLFHSGKTVQNSPCLLEVADVDRMTEGFYTEFVIDITKDFTDMSLISQLVGLNLHYNRAERSLAATPLVEKVVTYTKGGTKIDTKKSEYLSIMETLENLMSRLRSKLLATREDKLKFKKVEEETTIRNVEKNIMDMITNKKKTYQVNDDFIDTLELGD